MNKITAFFFLNHTAHIYHAISIAFELSCLEDQSVRIFSSTKRNFQLIRSIEKYYPYHNCEIIFLDVSTFYKVTRFLKKRMFPGFKAVFENNIQLISESDNFVSPSDDILGLKKIPNLTAKKYIHVLHGAGDLGYSFDSSLSKFDLVFLSGSRLNEIFYRDKERLSSISSVEANIIGYPKFELCDLVFNEGKKIFNNGKKTVLYAPHFDEKYSSWHKWGENVVEYFNNQEQFNLILAPHILMDKHLKKVIKSKKDIKDNIYVDVDIESYALINMSYVLEADIYLGDKSSQVYEFLKTPRPCVFLNAHQIDWKNLEDVNYEAWNLGVVVENIKQLENKLLNADSNQDKYQAKQIKALNERVSHFTEGSALHAAKILANF